MTTRAFILRGGRFMDPRRDELIDGVEVLVIDDLVMEIGPKINFGQAEVVDLKGRTVMPGLIDAHFHMYMNERNISGLAEIPPTYAAAKAARVLRTALRRGFTTVRDVAGGDYGMRRAALEGYVSAPRLFLSGRALSATGGHGDFRRLTDSDTICDCGSAMPLMSILVDGVPDCLKAAREELRKGADHIKIMASGGVSSEHDPLESVQFSADELRAITDEVLRWGRYVAAHAYSDEAIARAVASGVRSIEHGNFLESPTAALMASNGAFLVPTLIVYHANEQLGAASGKTPSMLAKNKTVLSAGAQSIELAMAAGVQVGFGTDLSMHTQHYQCEALAVHADVMSNIEVLRSATLVNAEIVKQRGKLGELIAGAFADLLVVDGDPIRDISLFTADSRNIQFVMRGGEIIMNRL